jgi:hypothetical protein
MATLPTNAEMTGSGVTEGGFKGKLNDFLTFIRDTMGSNGTVAAVRTALGLGALALKNDIVEADIATAAVTTGKVADLAITQAKITDLAVSTSKIAALAITDPKLGSNSVVSSKIATGAVTEPKIADGAAITRVIGDLAVTTPKIADLSVTPAKGSSAWPNRFEFISTDQTPTAGGLLTLAHGLGVVPKDVLCWMVCSTAEQNWAVGDPIAMGGSRLDFNGVSGAGWVIWADATNVYVRFQATYPLPAIINKTTGALFSPTTANWRKRYRAVA